LNIKNTNLVIIGAGGFGVEVYGIIDKDLYNVIGFFDDKNNIKNLPLKIIGHEKDIVSLSKNHKIKYGVIAIGDSHKRFEIHNLLMKSEINFPNVIDSSSRIVNSEIGIGSIIYPFSVIMSKCLIGNFTLINSGVTIGHDTRIGDYCNVNPGVNIAGKVSIGNRTLIGIGSIIREGVNIGNDVIVGAGSLVLNDVKDKSTVFGSPARMK